MSARWKRAERSKSFGTRGERTMEERTLKIMGSCGHRAQRCCARTKRVVERSVLFLNALDGGADGFQFFDDALVAAVDVIDTVDGGLPTRDQARQHESRAGAQI